MQKSLDSLLASLPLSSLNPGSFFVNYTLHLRSCANDERVGITIEFSMNMRDIIQLQDSHGAYMGCCDGVKYCRGGEGGQGYIGWTCAT